MLVSDTPCMREIYGPHAGYIDLASNPGNLRQITPPAADPAAVLNRYAWRESARRLAGLMGL